MKNSEIKRTIEIICPDCRKRTVYDNCNSGCAFYKLKQKYTRRKLSRLNNIFWVIATEPDGRMSYLKKECRSENEAGMIVDNLKKLEPEYRFGIVQIV